MTENRQKGEEKSSGEKRRGEERRGASGLGRFNSWFSFADCRSTAVVIDNCPSCTHIQHTPHHYTTHYNTPDTIPLHNTPHHSTTHTTPQINTDYIPCLHTSDSRDC